MEPKNLQEIPLDQLLPDPDNRHYGGFNQKKLEELAESLKSAGCLEPVLARPAPKLGPDSGHLFEIAAGERRWRAAKIAELATLPCIVRELTDLQMLEIRTIENVQREDVHPLDEAHGYSRLINTGQWSVKTVAEKVGKSIGYVYASLKLLELAPEAREQLAKGKITAGHAILIARLQPDDQRAVLKMLKERVRYYGEDEEDNRIMGVHELDTVIHRDYFRELDRAAFRKDDAGLLPEAGPCTTCIKHTGAQPGLFADVSKKDCCLDPRCYNAKLDALVERRKAELEGEKYVLAEGEYEIGRATPHGLVHRYEWREAKKKDPGAQRALIASGADRGRLTWGKVDKAHSTAVSPKEKERREREETQEPRKRQIAELTKRKLFDQVIAAEGKARTKNKKLALEVLRFTAGELFCQVSEYADLDDELLAVFWGGPAPEDEPKAERLVAKMDEPACLNLMLRCVLADCLADYRGDKPLIDAAKILRVDTKAIEREAREELKRREKEETQKKAAAAAAAKEPKGQEKLDLPAAADKPARKKRLKHGVCQVCGCTEDNPCEQGCSWANAEHTLCSACAPDASAADDPDEHEREDLGAAADDPAEGEDQDSELDDDEDPGD